MTTEAKTASKTITRTLPVTLTDAEMVAMARRLGDVQNEINAAEEAEKARKTEAKADLARLETERNGVAQIISSGRRSIDVECTLYFDYTAKRAVLVRNDTGDEIENRRMSDAELQTQFPFENLDFDDSAEANS
jgi:hypothetical protein